MAFVGTVCLMAGKSQLGKEFEGLVGTCFCMLWDFSTAARSALQVETAMEGSFGLATLDMSLVAGC